MNFGAPLQVRQALKMLGFSDNETRILLVLFRERKATTLEISKKSVINFSTVQYLLSNLVKRRIVRPSSKKEDVFETLSGSELKEWIEEQKQKNESIYSKATSEITDFLENLEESSWRPQVLYYEGKEGIKEIYEDMINTGKDIYTWTDIDRIYQTLGDYMYDFIEKRVKKNIAAYAIMPKNKMNLKHAEEGEKGEKRESKCIDNLPINGEIRIYDNKVAVIAFHGKKPVGFVLEGHIMTKMFMAIFENAWKKAL